MTFGYKFSLVMLPIVFFSTIRPWEAAFSGAFPFYIVGAFFIGLLLYHWRLYDVVIDGKFVIIKRGKHVEKIPAEDVMSVSGSSGFLREVVYLQLRDGRKIQFAGPFRWYDNFRPNPLVEEIEEELRARAKS